MMRITRSRAGRFGADRVASRSPGFVVITVLLSLAFHFAAALFLVYVPGFLPIETPPQEPATVELLMVEQKGGAPSEAGQPVADKPAPNPPEKPTPPAQESPPTKAPKVDTPAKAELAGTEPPKGEAPPSPSKSKPAPAVAAQGDEPVPLAAEQPPPETARPDPDVAHSQPPPSVDAAKEATAVPVPSSPQKAIDFDLEGTDSESNATVMGGQNVIPALPDDRFRNRPPVYPMEAQMRGQHGEVVIVIHVAESGLAAGADVMESSGVLVLDEAALTAVRKWHFHPAIKDGKAVPFDFPFRFIFEAN